MDLQKAVGCKLGKARHPFNAQPETPVHRLPILEMTHCPWLIKCMKSSHLNVDRSKVKTLMKMESDLLEYLFHCDVNGPWVGFDS